MVSFLDPSQLRAKLAQGFKGKLLIGVLTRTAYGDVDDHGNPVETKFVHRVEGFVDNYSAFYRQQSGIPENDVRIILIAGLGAVDPIKDDVVKFVNFPEYKIRQVSTDPGLAHYDCQSFGIKK